MTQLSTEPQVLPQIGINMFLQFYTILLRVKQLDQVPTRLVQFYFNTVGDGAIFHLEKVYLQKHFRYNFS